jgi:hypothetical protein
MTHKCISDFYYTYTQVLLVCVPPYNWFFHVQKKNPSLKGHGGNVPYILKLSTNGSEWSASLYSHSIWGKGA